MNKEQAKKRIEELTKEIDEHNYYYYVVGRNVGRSISSHSPFHSKPRLGLDDELGTRHRPPLVGTGSGFILLLFDVIRSHHRPCRR